MSVSIAGGVNTLPRSVFCYRVGDLCRVPRVGGDGVLSFGAEDGICVLLSELHRRGVVTFAEAVGSDEARGRYQGVVR